jgi:hypothetical protein
MVAGELTNTRLRQDAIFRAFFSRNGAETAEHFTNSASLRLRVKI